MAQSVATGAQAKTMYEESQESEVEELEETIVENVQGRQRPERKAGGMDTAKVVKYTYEEINTMKVAELRKAAKMLKLPSDGKKETLRRRLKEALGEEEEDEPRRDRRNHRSSEIDAITRQVASFTIRDVEDSMAHFSGDDKMPIQNWIDDFEDTSALLSWNELQKFVYGKRMLTGSARQFITFEREVKLWNDLKRRLIKEFQTEVNPATIHSQLFKRRQLPNENSRKYIYSMQEIANQGNIEEVALIQYIADGLRGERRDKAIFYGSRTLSELKRNIEIYDKIKEGTRQSTRVRTCERKNVASSRADASRTVRKHCYGCGSDEHEFRICPDKDKGLKCFKCNSFGHTAPYCKSDRSDKRTANVNCIHDVTDKVALKVNGYRTYALLDTGSETNIVSWNVYERVGKPALH